MTRHRIWLAGIIWLVGAAMALAGPLRAVPVDEGAQDPGFAAYRARLLQAVVARDIPFILSQTSPRVDLSFGGGGGHDDFRARLVVDPDTLSDDYRYQADEMRESYWAALEAVLRMGGRFEAGRAAFWAPYTWTAPLPDDYDAFETYFVTGESVALRDRPIRYGRVVARLTHDIVRTVAGGEGTRYLRVRLADGTTGYVHEDYLRSPIDYRAGFERKGGVWLMTTFIAGD